MAFSTVALGLAAERKWGLVLALVYMLEVVISDLIFMMTYMGDLSQGRNVRVAGLIGIVAVLILLYLWIRARDLLFGRHSARLKQPSASRHSIWFGVSISVWTNKPVLS